MTNKYKTMTKPTHCQLLCLVHHPWSYASSFLLHTLLPLSHKNLLPRIAKLVKGDHFPIKWEHHGTKHQGGDHLHDIHVTTTQEDVVVKLGIDDFNINHHHFPPYLNEDILVQSSWLGWYSIICAESNREWS